SFLEWSPDGKHLAYAIMRKPGAGYYPFLPKDRRGGRSQCPTDCIHMVLDGIESPGYFGLGDAHFLSDGRLAYSAFENDDWTTLIGSERLLGGGRLVAITPDGRHRAFAVGYDRNL